MRLHRVTMLITVVACGAAGIVISSLALNSPKVSSTPEQSAHFIRSTPPVLLASVGSQPRGDSSHPGIKHPIHTYRPSGPPMLDSGTVDSSGQPVLVECSICHGTRTPNFNNRYATDLKDFHKGVQVAHGTVTCLSCHHPDDYQSLRLADGTRVEFENVMQLCGQCHGPQLRDYQRGAHGGMSGYWDLSQGPQFKNNCVDCHQAHHPKFPLMRTEFKSRDRFLPAVGAGPEGGAHE